MEEHEERVEHSHNLSALVECFLSRILHEICGCYYKIAIHGEIAYC